MDAWQESCGYGGDAPTVSAETYEALQIAIEDHLADELDAEMMLVKDWVLVGSVSDLDSVSGREDIVLHRSENTSLYAITGLLEWGKFTMFPEEL